MNKSVIGLDADKSLGQTLENDRCMSTAINETRQQVLGIDSEFCNVESFVTGVADNWPTVLRKHKKKFTLATVLVIFCLDIPHITQVSRLSLGSDLGRLDVNDDKNLIGNR